MDKMEEILDKIGLCLELALGLNAIALLIVIVF